MAGRLRAAANTDDIRVAQIGFNGQGGGHIKNFLDRGNPIVALCDVDEKVLNRKADELKEKTGTQLDTYTDYRKLLERNDIDAVSIATPNHTARDHHDRGASGWQARVRRKAGVAQRLGRPADGRRGAQDTARSCRSARSAAPASEA